MSRQDRFSWFATQLRNRQTRRRKALATSARNPCLRLLHVEPLESRRMLAAFTVDSLLDNFDPGAPTTDGLITLREAILAANTNSAVGDAPAGSGADTIDFSVTGTINLTFGELEITDSLTINGPGTNQLTINAGGSSRIFNIDDGSNFSNDDVAISGLTLTGGNVAGDGGAIRSREGLTLSDSVVTGNTASGNGGGIDALSSSNIAGTFTTSIIDTVVSNNNTTGNGAEGGGIFVITSGGSTTTISGSTISGNDTSGSSSEGGGVFVSNFATTNISLSTISGNSSSGASSEGGGIYVVTPSGGMTTISQSTISGNSSDGSSADGGGIYVHTSSGGITTITDSTISGNSTNSPTSNADGGGIFIFDEGTTTIIGSTITGNASSDDGGGIAISTSSGNTTVEHSTIAFNTADPNILTGNGGGGLFVSVGTLTLDHTIVSGNTDNSTTAPEIFGAVGASFSLISDDTGATITDNGGNQIGTSGSPIDPLLGPLTILNGGPTETFALLASSPAIDAGDPGIVSPPANDQRGAPFARVIDDPVAPGAGIDLGAFERQTLASAVFPLVVDSVFDNDNGNYSSGELSLREAVELANGNLGGDTISFDPGLNGQTIMLTLGELAITDEVIINGLGASNLTIDAGNGTDFIKATGDGFRIFNIDDGNVGNVIDVEIVGLTLTGGDVSVGGGGGILVVQESLSLRDSVLTGNGASGSMQRGGGIYSYYGEVEVIRSTIRFNSVNGSSADGGGISSLGGILSIAQSTISGNTSNAGSAVHLKDGANATISDSTLTGNFVSYFGGALFIDNATLLATNSTISGNTAQRDGGALALDNLASATFAHSTITGNTSQVSGTGGGIYLFSGDVTLDHTILAGNIDFAGTSPDVFGPVAASYSLIGDDTGATITDNGGNQIGTGGAPIDPLLGLLTINGGPTETHALFPGSPAIDAGDSGIVAPPANDQRGAPFLRVADGGVNGVRIDIGAYERQTAAGLPPLIVDTAADEYDGDYSTGDLSLRDAVGLANGSVGVDTIEFDPGLTGATILLTLGELQIVDSATINGLGAGNLTIDANNNSRIFNIDDGDSAGQLIVAVDGLTLTQGKVSFPGDGGAIRSVEDLSVTNSTISNSYAFDGGGLYSSGNLSISGSTISGNTAGDGGGIYIKLVAGGTATIQGSTISGNFAGGDGGGVSIRADAGAAVTISGSTLTGNFGDSGGGVFAYSTGGAITTIQSSTISGNRGGDFGIYSQSYTGGGISARTAGGATMTIQSSTISGNSGLRGGGLNLISHNGGVTDLIDSDVFENGHDYGYSNKGGGIYARVGTGSAMSITGTAVRYNIAYYGGESLGGGIFLQNSGTATITGSTIHENRATGDIAKGGGIFTLTGGNTTIANSTISSNDVNYNGGLVNATAYGGGLYAYTVSGGTLTITGVTISDNQVEGEFVAGGGISLGLLVGLDTTNLGETIISGSTISGNKVYRLSVSSIGGGAGIHANTNGSGTTTITGTTISENKSEIDGGGVFLQGTGTSTITGSTISGNRAAYFGAGANILDATNVTIAHSTITENQADLNFGFSGEVGGIFVTSSSVSLDHTIVAGNTETIANAPDVGGAVTARFSIIGDDTGATITDNGGNQIGTSGSPIDPLLGSLTNHGGLTKTHRLLTGSPAIDMGDAAFVGPPDSDQRGAVFDRVADGDGDLNARIDIGAYEIQALVPQAFVVDTLVDEFDADASSGDFSLREAIERANGTPGLTDTIEFATGLTGTISLVLDQLKITDDVTVTGPGADLITIDAQRQSRVLNINDEDDANHLSVQINGLTFTRGLTRRYFDVSFLAGGAIHSRESLTLTGSVVSDSNTDISPGGGLYLRLFSGATATIVGSTITGNTASGANGGGGIFALMETGTMTSITGSTISGNQSDANGGGIYASGPGDVTISYSTITGNTADADSNGQGSGGGIRHGTLGTFTLDHTIVAGNIDNSATAVDVGGPVAATYSLIGDDTGATITDNGGNQIGTGGGAIDPLLGPLADNGGPTPTHALMPGSPALDAGDPAAVAGVGNVPDFDQRGAGFDRVMNGRIEIGAYEVNPSADFDSSGFIDGFDFLLWQRGFGTPAPTATPLDGDANFDQDVDGNDLSIWESQFGQAAPTIAPVVAAAEAMEPIAAAVTFEPVEVAQSLAAVEVVTIVEPVFGAVHSVSTSDAVEPDRTLFLNDELVDAIFRRSGKRLRHNLHNARAGVSQAALFVEHVFSEVQDLYHTFDFEHDKHDREHWRNRLSKRAEATDDFFGALDEEDFALESSL